MVLTLCVVHLSCRPEALNDRPGYVCVGVGPRTSPGCGGRGGVRRRRAAAGTDLFGSQSRGRGWRCASGPACSTGCGCGSVGLKMSKLTTSNKLAMIWLENKGITQTTIEIDNKNTRVYQGMAAIDNNEEESDDENELDQ